MQLPAEAATDTAKSTTAVETQDPLLATSALYGSLQSQSKNQERCLQKEHCDILQLYLCISEKKKKWKKKNHREEPNITHLLQAPPLGIFSKTIWLDSLTLSP